MQKKVPRHRPLHARDVTATTALYQKWLEYLSFKEKEESAIDF
ncbi:MAG: hypothetical protein UZ19_OD1000016 [Parcubacteria bacterium OLB19]|nr:MAG: hypothetical protein UZ19_OD1000016 [Parcubacteria bacterium OLB19]